MKIVDWITEFGLIALQWYALYVLIAACAFGGWLWYTVWHHDQYLKSHDVSHHHAD